MYEDEDDPWSGILSSTVFVICSTINWLKGCTPLQLVFACDVILPIRYEADWESICQRNQAQINKDDI